MKRLFVIALLIVTTAAFAQEHKELDAAAAKQLRSKVFEIHNRDPRQIADTIRLLGSGVSGTGINVNPELKTLTVRDFPENIATMDEAIKRLDQPAPATPDIEFKISVLIGSKSPFASASVPDDLEPVVKQLQSALRYAHYGLMTTAIQRTKPGDLVEGSGVAEATLLGLTPSQDRPVMYSYRMRRIAVNDSSIDMEKFEFSMRVPIAVKTGEVQYQSVGFDTPVTLRNGEKVVIGTTSMGDKALIVVVTATK
jgi:hypothetical protein